MRLVMERLCCDDQTEGGLSGDDNVYLTVSSTPSSGLAKHVKIPRAGTWNFDSDEDDPNHCRYNESLFWGPIDPGSSVAINVCVSEEDSSSTDDYIGSFQLAVARRADGTFSEQWTPGVGTEHLVFGHKHEFRMKGIDGDVNYVGTFHVALHDRIKIIPNADPTVVEGEAEGFGGDYDSAWTTLRDFTRILHWLPVAKQVSHVAGDTWHVKLWSSLVDGVEARVIVSYQEKPGMRKMAFSTIPDSMIFSGFVVLKQDVGARVHLALRNSGMPVARATAHLIDSLERAITDLCGP